MRLTPATVVGVVIGAAVSTAILSRANKCLRLNSTFVCEVSQVDNGAIAMHVEVLYTENNWVRLSRTTTDRYMIRMRSLNPEFVYKIVSCVWHGCGRGVNGHWLIKGRNKWLGIWDLLCSIILCCILIILRWRFIIPEYYVVELRCIRMNYSPFSVWGICVTCIISGDSNSARRLYEKTRCLT